MALNRNQWSDLANVTVDFQVPRKVGNFLTELLLASHEGLCSMQCLSYLKCNSNDKATTSTSHHYH